MNLTTDREGSPPNDIEVKVSGVLFPRTALSPDHFASANSTSSHGGLSASTRIASASEVDSYRHKFATNLLCACVGSLEVGKQGTLLITTGTPLDMTSTIHQAYIQGRELNMMDIQKRFFQKYMEKIKQHQPKPVP